MYLWKQNSCHRSSSCLSFLNNQLTNQFPKVFECWIWTCRRSAQLEKVLSGHCLTVTLPARPCHQIIWYSYFQYLSKSWENCQTHQDKGWHTQCQWPGECCWAIYRLKSDHRVTAPGSPPDSTTHLQSGQTLASCSWSQDNQCLSFWGCCEK